MVNTSDVRHPNPFVNARRELPWPPPDAQLGRDQTRIIPFKVWDLEELQTLASGHLSGIPNVISAVTRDCFTDLQNEKLTLDDVADIILLLEPEHYHNSWWCMASRKAGITARPELQWFPCDAYKVTVELEDEHECVYDRTYYIKLCRTIGGTMLLIVSLHPTDY
jgi:hypothetical protein